MTRTPNERQDDTDLRVAVGVITSQVRDMKVTLSNIERKIDNNSYVHTADYIANRKDDAENYATKDEIKPIKNMFYAVITTIILGLITAFMTFVVRGGIK